MALRQNVRPEVPLWRPLDRTPVAGPSKPLTSDFRFKTTWAGGGRTLGILFLTLLVGICLPS